MKDSINHLLNYNNCIHRFHFKKNLKRIVSELYVRDNCHPFKASLLIWVQLPMWVCLSLALRNLSLGMGHVALGESHPLVYYVFQICSLVACNHLKRGFYLTNIHTSAHSSASEAGLATGGALWFPDLTLPDSTWIMPVSLGLINLIITEVRHFWTCYLILM